MFTRDPKHRKLTEEELALLSDIFRLIPREIRDDNDKKNLAPGELGISYIEGAFYVRNPHTGELFSPNSLDYVRQVINRYNPNNDTFNADRVNRVRFYTSLGQLSPLPIDFTPDTVIRQMDVPSVLFAPIRYDNYDTLGWPSASGTCVVYKSTLDDVYVVYYDSNGFNVYTGKYLPVQRIFTGWVSVHLEAQSFEPEGDGHLLIIHQESDIHDLDFITITADFPIEREAYLKADGMDAAPITDINGDPLDHQIGANNTIMLMYDDSNKRWILTDPTLSPEQTEMELLKIRNIADKEYFENQLDLIRASLEELAQTTSQRINEVEATEESHYNELLIRPGVLKPEVHDFIAEEDGTDSWIIDDFDGAKDKLIVNYGQTILRNRLDYEISDNSVRLLNGVSLYKDEMIRFVVLKQA